MLHDFWANLLSPYVSGSGRDWLRILGLTDQEIVILSLVIFAVWLLALVLLDEFLKYEHNKSTRQ